MYLAPIARPKPPVSLRRRRTTGTMLLLIGMLVMLPWFALFGALGVLSAALKGLAALPATLAQLVDHAGDHAHGF